jgi:hypothetical protein
MNIKELEQLDKKSIYTTRINDDLKNQVVYEQLNELNKVIKREMKKNELIVLVMKVN